MINNHKMLLVCSKSTACSTSIYSTPCESTICCSKYWYGLFSVSESWSWSIRVRGVKRPGDILSEADTESDTELVTESVTETKALYQSKSLCENQMDVDIADENIKDYKKYDKETKNMLSKAVMD